MFRLRLIFLIIASCLILIISPQPNAWMNGTDLKCAGKQVNLAEITNYDQITGENEPVIATCYGIQAIAPKGISLPLTASVNVFSLPAYTQLELTNRQSGIDPPPRALV